MKSFLKNIYVVLNLVRITKNWNEMNHYFEFGLSKRKSKHIWNTTLKKKKSYPQYLDAGREKFYVFISRYLVSRTKNYNQLSSIREVDVDCTKGHYVTIEKDRKCPQRHSETWNLFISSSFWISHCNKNIQCMFSYSELKKNQKRKHWFLLFTFFRIADFREGDVPVFGVDRKFALKMLEQLFDLVTFYLKRLIVSHQSIIIPVKVYCTLVAKKQFQPGK